MDLYNRKNAVIYKRKAVVLFEAILFAYILLSVFLISLHSCHTCEDRNCVICTFIKKCEKRIRELHGARACTGAAVLPASVFVVFVLRGYLFIPRESLLSMKTRFDC